MPDQKKRIVYFEDDLESIEVLRLPLSGHNYELIGAPDARDGLELVRVEKPDMILLDLMMPEMDGWQVYQQLKADQDTVQIPVIIITAKVQSIDKVHAKIAKVDDYISKPFNIDELLERIEFILMKKNLP